MPKQSAALAKKYEKQSYLPPEDRLTQSLGTVLLRAYRNVTHCGNQYTAWTTRKRMLRLTNMGLVKFKESIFKAGKLQYQIVLTRAGVERAKELG